MVGGGGNVAAGVSNPMDMGAGSCNGWGNFTMREITADSSLSKLTKSIPKFPSGSMVNGLMNRFNASFGIFGILSMMRCSNCLGVISISCLAAANPRFFSTSGISIIFWTRMFNTILLVLVSRAFIILIK